MVEAALELEGSPTLPNLKAGPQEPSTSFHSKKKTGSPKSSSLRGCGGASTVPYEMGNNLSQRAGSPAKEQTTQAQKHFQLGGTSVRSSLLPQGTFVRDGDILSPGFAMAATVADSLQPVVSPLPPPGKAMFLRPPRGLQGAAASCRRRMQTWERISARKCG